MRKTVLFAIFAVLTISLASIAILEESDESDASVYYRSTHLRGTIFASQYSTDIQGQVNVETTNGYYTFFKYRIVNQENADRYIGIGNSGWDYSINNSSIKTELSFWESNTDVTLYWDWDRSYSRSDIRLWINSATMPSDNSRIYTVDLMDTYPTLADLEYLDQVKYVTVTASEHSPPSGNIENAVFTITNMNYEDYNGTYPISTSSTGAGISNWDCRALFYVVSFVKNEDSWGTISRTSLEVWPGSTFWQNGNVFYIRDALTNEVHTTTLTPATADDQYSYGYNFWTYSKGSPITSDITVTANFTRTTNQYSVHCTITPTDYGDVSVAENGTVIGSGSYAVSVDYNTSYSISGNVITVGNYTFTAVPNSATDEFTYVFARFLSAEEYPSSGTVTENMNWYTLFGRNTNQYTVTIKSNNTELGVISTENSTSISVNYGTTFSVNSNNVLTVNNYGYTYTPTPTDDSAEWDYSFDGWSGVNTVTGNTDITAIFSVAKQQYTITVNVTGSDNGSVSIFDGSSYLSTNSFVVEYGTSVSTSANVITIGNYILTANIANPPTGYTNDFDGWTGNTGDVESDRTIVATFSRTINQYRVTVISSNDTYGSVNCSNASVDDNGHLYVVVDYNTSISADGTTLTVGTYTFSAVVATDSAEWDYSFVSWNDYSETVSGNLTVKAMFSRATQYYTVTIAVSGSNYGSVSISHNGTLIEGNSFSVAYNTAINTSDNRLIIGSYTVTASPNTATTEFTYSFSNWSNNSGNVLSAREITATFSVSTNQYRVTVISNNTDYGMVDCTNASVDSDNHLYVDVDYGTDISVSDNSMTIGEYIFTAYTSGDTDEWDYSFVQWNNVAEEVTGNVTITAQFSATKNQYVVSFVINGSNYGGISISNNGVTVEGNSFSVEYDTSISKSGNTLTIGTYTVIAIPNEMTQSNVYTFTGWSNADENITSARQIQASFSTNPRYYTVQIESNDESLGTVSESSVSVAYGTIPQASGDILTIGAYTIIATPTADTENISYWLDSWEGLQTIKGNDVTIRAVFTSGDRHYKVVFEVEGYGTTSKATLNVVGGTAVSINGNQITIGETTVTATPAESDDHYTYSFSEWENTASPIMTDRTITAIFTSTVNQYTVTFTTNKAYGSWNVDSALVDYGTPITIGTDSITIGEVVYTISFDDTSSYRENRVDSITTSYDTMVTGNGTVNANLSRTTTVPAFSVINPESADEVYVGKEGDAWDLLRIIPILVIVGIIMFAVMPWMKSRYDYYEDNDF